MTSTPTCTHEETYAAQSMYVQRMQMFVQRMQWHIKCSWCVLPIAMHMLRIPNACLHICPFTLCNHEAKPRRTCMSRDAVSNMQQAGCFQAARLAQTGRPTGRLVSQLAGRSLGRSLVRPVGRSTGPSAGRWAGRSFGLSVGLPTGRPVCRPTDRPTERTTGRSADRPTDRPAK